MAITEETRYRLHQRLTEVLGEDEAATLMEHLPPIGWADVATKRDLDHLRELTAADLDRFRLEIRSELGAEIGSLRSELAEVRSGLVLQATRFDADLAREVGSVREDLGGRIDRLRADVQRDLRTLTIAVVGANTALAAVVVAALRFV